MRERELATLFVEIGLQSGVAIERVIDEVGALTMPSFINQQTFRGALADAAESHLRRQFEDQLSRLRQRIGANRPVVGRVQAVEEPEVKPFTGEAFAATPPETPAAVVAEIPQEEEMPSDATLVWTTQHGQRSSS